MEKMGKDQIEEKLAQFRVKCRQKGLKITPQRLAVYEELLKSDKHPCAEVLCKKVRKKYPNISLDTVNRTLITLAEMGVAFIVEGSGDTKRFDGNLSSHQHFRCNKCKRIFDYHHEPFDNIDVPEEIAEHFEITKATVYLEGICKTCLQKKKQSG